MPRPPTAVPPPRGLRERKKRRTRERLGEAAWRLAETRGFDQVTADDIAARAEVSRSTFFRYFPRKEAVLLAWREPLLELFRAELARRVPGESGLATVRRGLLVVASRYQADRERIVRRQALINAQPALVGEEYEVDRAWEDAIAEVLLAGEGRGAAARRRALLRAGAVLGVLRVTLRTWMAGGGRDDLAKLGSEALDLLAADLGSEATRSRRREG